MRTWMKYLIIGWSIVSVGIVILSFQLTKNNYIKEDYFICATLKEPEKQVTSDDKEWVKIGEGLFEEGDVFDKISITKKEFVERMKKAKGVTIESKTKVDGAIYIVLPIYAFTVWAIPILVFSLVGLLFSRKGDSK